MLQAPTTPIPPLGSSDITRNIQYAISENDQNALQVYQATMQAELQRRAREDADFAKAMQTFQTVFAVQQYQDELATNEKSRKSILSYWEEMTGEKPPSDDKLQTWEATKIALDKIMELRSEKFALQRAWASASDKGQKAKSEVPSLKDIAEETVALQKVTSNPAAFEGIVRAGRTLGSDLGSGLPRFNGYDDLEDYANTEPMPEDDRSSMVFTSLQFWRKIGGVEGLPETVPKPPWIDEFGWIDRQDGNPTGQLKDNATKFAIESQMDDILKRKKEVLDEEREYFIARGPRSSAEIRRLRQLGQERRYLARLYNANRRSVLDFYYKNPEKVPAELPEAFEKVRAEGAKPGRGGKTEFALRSARRTPSAAGEAGVSATTSVSHNLAGERAAMQGAIASLQGVYDSGVTGKELYDAARELAVAQFVGAGAKADDINAVVVELLNGVRRRE